MAKYGSSSVSINYDDSGGTARDVSQYIDTINGIKITAKQDTTTAFGDSWGEKTPTGMSEVADIVVEGFYDDTATSGPHVVFRAVDTSPAATSRTLAIAHGGTNGTFTIETRCAEYELQPKVGNLHRFKARLETTGSGAWS